MANNPKDVRDVLNRLADVKSHGEGKWTASCPVPGHKTPRDHFSIQDAGAKALVKSHGRHHSYDEICTAVGFDSLKYVQCAGGHKPG